MSSHSHRQVLTSILYCSAGQKVLTAAQEDAHRAGLCGRSCRGSDLILLRVPAWKIHDDTLAEMEVETDLNAR